jgi:hypothetical protein
MEAPIFNILKELCPVICALVGEKKEFWNRVNENYKTRINYIKNEVKTNEINLFSKMFLDNWLLHEVGEEEPKYFLKYFDSVIAKILNNIPDELHDKLRNIVKQVIGNFDKEDGKRTTNSIGEIFVIDYYLKRDFSLGAIELRLPNMKPVDFLFRNNKTNEYLLLEVINIHPNKNQIESKDLLSTFFIHRYVNKFKDKSKNNLNIASGYNLKLFPIVWTDTETIKKYSEFFIDTCSDMTEEIHILHGLIINKTDYHYFLTPVRMLI